MKGFTIIEMLVSVAIFTIVMVLAMGALISLSAADRKAESIKTAVNNLNFALDSMSRDLRTATQWGCGTTLGNISSCFLPNHGTDEITYYSSQYGGQILYQYDTSPSDCNQTGTVGCIARSTNGGTTWSAVTAPEIVITGFQNCSGTTPCLFYVVGAEGSVQPKMVITLSGYIQISATQTTSFDLQTAVTQRLYDQ